MADVGIKELLEAGVHFGHQTRRWNPRMRRYIHGERDGIHIIDLLQTEELLGGPRLPRRDRRARAAWSCSWDQEAGPRLGRGVGERCEMPFVNRAGWAGCSPTSRRSRSASTACTSSAA